MDGLCANAVEQLEGKTEIPLTEIAMIFEPKALSYSDFNDIERLEPCGAQNAKPLICIKNARLKNPKIFKEKTFAADIDGSFLRCLWFTPTIPFAQFTGQPLDLVGELLKESTGSVPSYKLIIRDACPASIDVFI